MYFALNFAPLQEDTLRAPDLYQALATQKKFRKAAWIHMDVQLDSRTFASGWYLI